MFVQILASIVIGLSLCHSTVAVSQATTPPPPPEPVWLTADEIEQLRASGYGVVIQRQQDPSTTVIETAEGVGAGQTVSGHEAKLTIDGSAPGIALPGGTTATGGSLRSVMEGMGSIATASWWANPLLYIGLVIALVGGFMIFKLNLKTDGSIVAGVGVTLMAIAFMPMLLVYAVIAIVGLLAWRVFKTSAGEAKLRTVAEANYEAARALAGGIYHHDVDSKSREAVLEAVVKEIDRPTDREVINGILQKDGITSI